MESDGSRPLLKYGTRFGLRFLACNRMLSLHTDGSVSAVSAHPLAPGGCHAFDLRFERSQGGSNGQVVCYGDTVSLAVPLVRGHQDQKPRAHRHVDLEPRPKERRDHSAPLLTARARWSDRGGDWQQLVIEGAQGPQGQRTPVRIGDRIYLRVAKTYPQLGVHMRPHLFADPTEDDSDRRVHARWEDRGDWQALEVSLPPSDDRAIVD